MRCIGGIEVELETVGRNTSASDFFMWPANKQEAGAQGLGALNMTMTHTSPTSAVVELGLKFIPPLPTSMGMFFAPTATARVKTKRIEENIVIVVSF